MTFEESFRAILVEKFPAWAPAIQRSITDNRPITIRPRGCVGLPFAIQIRYDTVTILPFCEFGLDYSFAASREDIEERSHLVFAKVLSDIADFVAGRTVLAIRRYRFLFLKLGWDVRFVPVQDRETFEGKGAVILTWPHG